MKIMFSLLFYVRHCHHILNNSSHIISILSINPFCHFLGHTTDISLQPFQVAFGCSWNIHSISNISSRVIPCPRLQVDGALCRSHHVQKWLLFDSPVQTSAHCRTIQQGIAGSCLVECLAQSYVPSQSFFVTFSS